MTDPGPRMEGCFSAIQFGWRQAAQPFLTLAPVAGESQWRIRGFPVSRAEIPKYKCSYIHDFYMDPPPQQHANRLYVAVKVNGHSDTTTKNESR